jgi:pimeloyl-ACP methyl ester carboxylesterase
VTVPHFSHDYTALDRPELVRFVFYPRKDFSRPPPNAVDRFVTVDAGVALSCRFYVHDRESPAILYFHGNGEVVSDYDYVAPIYASQAGANLFVADYRGYGGSGGRPTFSSMVADAHRVFEDFLAARREGGHSGGIFVMGRSLGSVSAIELAASHQDGIHGLIVESGFASTVRLMTRLGFPGELLGIEDPGFPNLSRIRAVMLPTLIIHGQYDNLIPLEEGRDLFAGSPAAEKRLVIIPEAGHNDIMVADMPAYFGAIREFVTPDRGGRP